jgi:hypothetical protein
VNLLDKLRQHAAIPDAYSWATIGLTVTDARALVDGAAYDADLIDRLHQTVDQLRAELAAAARRCTDCGRSARQLTEWRDDAGQVVAWLGPSCHRARVDGQPVAALPIGDAS